MALEVLVVDDDGSFREVVMRVLGRAVAVVGQATSGEEAVRLAQALRPEVVLMSIAVAGLDAISATRSIKAGLPGTKVLLLTGHDEEAYLSATGKSGADGFLPKRLVRAELLAAIRDLAGAAWRRSVGHDRRSRMARPASVAGWDGRERRGRREGAEGGAVGVGDGEDGENGA